jgi:hypothetical protein
MLPAYDGRPMIRHAVAGLAADVDDLIVTILAEHEAMFHVTEGLRRAFGRPVRTCVLPEPTRSQSDTVAQTLRAEGLDEPFLVKDSDNTFVLDEIVQPDDYVCVDSLNNYESINPRNKSYLQVDHKGTVTNIREKVVISDLFNVGGYYFSSPRRFLEYYEPLAANTAQWNREIFLSDVIGAMILDGVPFRARTITGYRDWGTIREWKRALLDRKAYFVLLDGFVFERGSEFFRPRFEEVRPHAEAIRVLASLASAGHQIVYLSIRPAGLAELTRTQLREANAPAGQFVFDCPIAKWMLLAAPHATLPFRTVEALEASPDDVNLAELLSGDSFDR